MFKFELGPADFERAYAVHVHRLLCARDYSKGLKLFGNKFLQMLSFCYVSDDKTWYCTSFYQRYEIYSQHQVAFGALAGDCSQHMRQVIGQITEHMRNKTFELSMLTLNVVMADCIHSSMCPKMVQAGPEGIIFQLGHEQLLSTKYRV